MQMRLQKRVPLRSLASEACGIASSYLPVDKVTFGRTKGSVDIRLLHTTMHVSMQIIRSGGKAILLGSTMLHGISPSVPVFGSPRSTTFAPLACTGAGDTRRRFDVVNNLCTARMLHALRAPCLGRARTMYLLLRYRGSSSSYDK